MHFFLIKNKQLPLTVLLIRDQQLGEQRDVNPIISSGMRSRTLAICVISPAFEDEVGAMLFPLCKRLLKE
jgi:hypothetical protein